MADAKKEAAPAAPAAAAPQKSSKLMPILVGLNSLLLFGVLGFMGYSMMHKDRKSTRLNSSHRL